MPATRPLNSPLVRELQALGVPFLTADDKQLVAPSGAAVALGSPGTYDISTYPGVTFGAGLPQDVRQANGIALQAAFVALAAAGLLATAPAGTFEYEATGVEGSRNVGLQVPYNSPGLACAGMQVGGAAGTTFRNFAAGHPNLTLGSIGPSASAFTYGGRYTGFSTLHGSSQAGLTQADSLLIGNHFMGTFDQISASAGGFPGYNAIKIGDGASNFFFSCNVGTIKAFSCQQSMLRAPANTTGSFFANVYLGGGTFGSRAACAATPLWMGINGLQIGFFAQLNVEWCDCPANNYVARFDGDVVVGNLHFEGNKLNGFNAGLIQAVTGRVVLGNAQFLDNWIGAAATGTPRVFSGYGDFRYNVQSGWARWNGAGYNAEAVCTQPFCMVMDDASVVNRAPSAVIENFEVTGNTGQFTPDSLVPAASWLGGGTMVGFARMTYDAVLSRTEKATLVAPSGNGSYTVYGVNKEARVKVATAITADRKVILAANLTASGIGSTTPRLAGDTVRVSRTGAATGAFNVLVRDSGDTTTYATLAATGDSNLCNTGSAWA